MTLAELLARHPELARRTAQRRIARLIGDKRIIAEGRGRARRYLAAGPSPFPSSTAEEDAFASHIPLAADSRDVLGYVDRPLGARRPVGYQREFLDTYRPNETWYLSEPLRRQLRRMGGTGRAGTPEGTHGRAILARLLVDLSWASSHLEGNTYTRLDTRELIEHGKVARGKALLETQMILNHKAAIELLVENAGVVGFDRYTLLNLKA